MKRIAITFMMVLAVFILMAAGGVTSISADSPNMAPPTVVLPTPNATRVPPAVQPQQQQKTAPTRSAPSSVKQATTAPKAAPQVLAPRGIPGPSGSFSSGFTIQNMEATTANCTYQFFGSGGASAYTSATLTVPANGSVFTYVPGISGLAAGQYSGVVSCDKQVAAVVNTTNNTNTSGGSYDGIRTAATTWYAPNAFNNYFNYYTNFVVQNTTSSSVPVTLQVINASGAVVATQSQTIAANGYWSPEQTGLAGLAANTPYSAKITATGGNIAVESNIFGSGGSDTGKLYSYTPFTGGSTTAYAPVIMNNYFGYITALTVQNLGTAATTVTVTYGTGLTQSQSINPSASYVFYTPNSGLPVGTLTSARITSSGGQNIVALVNETNNYGRAASYTAFASGATTARAPIILKRYVNYNTSVTCQNIGGSATNMTITYSNGATSTQNNIPANGTALFYQPNEAGLPNSFNGSARITSSGQNIVCVMNEDQNEGSDVTTVKDQLFSYEGF